MEQKQRSVAARVWEAREEKINRQNTEDFQGSEKIVYDAVMMDTGHCTFV